MAKGIVVYHSRSGNTKEMAEIIAKAMNDSGLATECKSVEAVRADDLQDASMVVDGNVALTASVSVLKAIAEGEGPQHSLLALGYAGWGPGQLDDEIQRNGWLCVGADDSLLFGPDLDGRWKSAMAKLGVNLHMLSGEAGRA